MTTSQDERPTSRRARRESERGFAESGPSTPVPQSQSSYSPDQVFPGFASHSEQPAAAHESRHGAVPAEQPLRRPRASGNPRDDDNPPQFRARDFSPEGRGTSFTATPQVPYTPPSVGSESLTYQTLLGGAQASSAPQFAATPDTPKVVTESPSPLGFDPGPVEQTLSRRELRALRDAALAQEPGAASDGLTTQLPPLVEPNGQSTPSATQTFFATPTQEPAFNFAPIPPQPQPVVQEAPIREVITAPEVYSTGTAPSATDDDAFSALIGHHRRDVAASDSITTSALIMPAFPQTGQITSPLSGTGEILLTGSVNLPHSLATTGLNPARFDSPDIDKFFETSDREMISPDAAPVSASSAVSSHTSTQSVLISKPPRGGKMVMVLGVTGAALAVGVVLLFAAGMIFKIF